MDQPGEDRRIEKIHTLLAVVKQIAFHRSARGFVLLQARKANPFIRSQNIVFGQQMTNGVRVMFLGLQLVPDLLLHLPIAGERECRRVEPFEELPSDREQPTQPSGSGRIESLSFARRATEGLVREIAQDLRRSLEVVPRARSGNAAGSAGVLRGAKS